MVYLDFVKKRGSVDLETCKILYKLLKERTKSESISHKKMPSFQDHCLFVRLNSPYKIWYLIYNKENEIVGATYISDNDEIGISIFKKHRRQGYAKQAIRKLVKQHKYIKKFYANINPKNQASIELFKSLKFKPLQLTYSLS